MLALVAHRPDPVRTHETYLRSGLGPAMAKFIRLTSHQGPFPDDFLDQPDPDPAAFGLPSEDDARATTPSSGRT